MDPVDSHMDLGMVQNGGPNPCSKRLTIFGTRCYKRDPFGPLLGPFWTPFGTPFGGPGGPEAP